MNEDELEKVVEIPIENDEAPWYKRFLAWGKQKTRNAKKTVVRVVKDHPEIAGATALAVTSIATGLIKSNAKNKQQKAEQELKDLYVYDRRLGHYWKLRRKLKSSEWLAVQHRYELGESMGDILEELRVLE